MNPNMISKTETKSIIDNTGLYQQTSTWIHNQKRVYSVQVHCFFCDKSYNAHNNTFKKHLLTKKHKERENEHEQWCIREMNAFNEFVEDN